MRNNLWRKHCLDGLMEGDWTLMGSLWGKEILNRKKARHVKHSCRSWRVQGIRGNEAREGPGDGLKG